MTKRVLIAMSGGVDSSVAAARLVSDGYDVIGVTLHLWDYPDDGSILGRCCAPEDIHDARRVADKLGIPHYTFDRRELFKRKVITPFVDAYLEGNTPSPCVQCNRTVKIHELLELAVDLGADCVATGHYARLDQKACPPQLLRASDSQKDQSYFLHMLSPQVLAQLIFPLGECTKSEVREQAVQLGLSGAEKSESQELCFVPKGRYDKFVDERADGRLRPGNIVNESGQTLGQHTGIHRFTIGQRRNLGVSVGKRTYVVGLDKNSQQVVLGDKEQLLSWGATLQTASLAPDVELPLRCSVAVRYRGKPMPAWVEQHGEQGLRIHFDEPIVAVVPGQVAVLYQQDRVLGGGTISNPLRAPAQPTAGISSEQPLAHSVEEPRA